MSPACMTRHRVSACASLRHPLLCCPCTHGTVQGSSWDRSRRRFYIHNSAPPELEGELLLCWLHAAFAAACTRRSLLQVGHAIWPPVYTLLSVCHRTAHLPHCPSPPTAFPIPVFCLQSLCGPLTWRRSGHSWKRLAAMWRAPWRRQQQSRRRQNPQSRLPMAGCAAPPAALPRAALAAAAAAVLRARARRVAAGGGWRAGAACRRTAGTAARPACPPPTGQPWARAT